MMELLLQNEYTVKYIYKKAPSQMLAWVLNTPLHSEDILNVLFPSSIFQYKILQICYFFNFASFNSSNMLLKFELSNHYLTY